MAPSKPLFKPVTPVLAYQRVVEQIEGAIARGELRPGQRLSSERELMGQFSVSRSTIREALRVLQAGGLLRSRPGDPHGAEVLAFSPATLHKSMTSLARVDELSLCELVQFRMLLDASANQLAARLHTPAELTEMDAAISRMRAAADRGYDEFSAADVDFHEAVARASRNTLIQVCNDVVRSVVLNLIADRIVQSPDRRALMRQSIDHHAEVLEAVRARDGALAARLARQSLYDYYAGYLAEPERAALQALLE